MVWVIVLLGLGYKFRNTKVGKLFLLADLALVLLLTNPFLYNRVASNWQVQSVEINDIIEPYDVGIVLGGYACDKNGKFHLDGKTGNRLISALDLYSKGKINKILFCLEEALKPTRTELQKLYL